jgi:DNA-binding NarL/FixJ family response regulator
VAASGATVLLLDEDAMLRRGIRELLEAAGMRAVGEAASAEEAIAQGLATTSTLVLVGARSRISTGLDAIRALRRQAAEARIVMLAGSADPADAEAAIRAGACGYLLKDDPPEEIVAAARAALAGGSPLSPRIVPGLLGRLALQQDGDGGRPELTARERSVLERLAAGRRNSEIAEDLSISVYTVKRHVSHLLAKLDAENRTQAAVAATRRGLL